MSQAGYDVTAALTQRLSRLAPVGPVRMSGRVTKSDGHLGSVPRLSGQYRCGLHD